MLREFLRSGGSILLGSLPMRNSPAGTSAIPPGTSIVAKRSASSIGVHNGGCFEDSWLASAGHPGKHRHTSSMAALAPLVRREGRGVRRSGTNVLDLLLPIA